MEKDVAVGSEGKLALKIEGGKVIIQFNYDGKQLSSQHSVALDADAYIQLLEDAIPGDGIPEMVLEGLKAAIKLIP